MKYQSELIKDILEERGHKKSSLHYESECIESWIEENKGGYPKLCDYQGEWLNYIAESPIGVFPYEAITDVTEATVNNVVPFAFKSAILKGNTLVNLKYSETIINNSKKYVVIKNFSNNKQYIAIFPYITNAKYALYNATTGKFIIDYNSSNKLIFTSPSSHDEVRLYVSFDDTSIELPSSALDIVCVEYQDGMENWDIPYFEGMQSVQMPVLTTSNEDGTKTNILTVNEDVTLRSNGSVYDELDLLTGKLTQRIDEDGSVLTQEVVKTVGLTVINQDGETLSKFTPIEGTMNIATNGTPIKPTVSMEIPVEAINQNLMSFIEEE